MSRHGRRMLGTKRRISAKSAATTPNEIRKFTTSQTTGGRKPKLAKYFPAAPSAALIDRETSSRKPIARTMQTDRKPSLTKDQIPLATLADSASHSLFSAAR